LNAFGCKTQSRRQPSFLPTTGEEQGETQEPPQRNEDTKILARMVHHEILMRDDAELACVGVDDEDEEALIVAANQYFGGPGRDFRQALNSPKKSARTLSSSSSTTSEGRRSQRRHSSLESIGEKNPLLTPKKPSQKRAARRCSIATSDYSEHHSPVVKGVPFVIRPQRRQSIGNGNYRFQGNLPANLRKSSGCLSSLSSGASVRRSSSLLSLSSLNSVCEQNAQDFEVDIDDGSSLIDWERVTDDSSNNSTASSRRNSLKARRRSSFGVDSLNGAFQAVEYDRSRMTGGTRSGRTRRATMKL